MKKILFALLVLSSVAHGQNLKKFGSEGGIHMAWGEWFYQTHPTSLVDSQLIDWKTLKDTAIAIRSAIGGGGGLTSGRANWYVKYLTATTDQLGNLQDTLVGTYLYRKEFYLNVPGSFTQNWAYFKQDEVAHTTSFRLRNPYTTDGFEFLFDSTTKQVRETSFGTNVDKYLTGYRNINFNNTGTLIITNSMTVAGIVSSAQITSNATGSYLFGGKASAANNFAGLYLDNDLNERFEFRVAGSTYGSYPVRTAHIFSGLRDGMNIYLYGASPTLKTYVGGLTSTELMSTMGVGYTMFKAGYYLNFGNTSSSSGYGLRDNSGVIERKNSGGSWEAILSALTAQAFGSTPNANGYSVSSNNIVLQPADGTNPGGVSTTTQTFGGQKEFLGSIKTNSVTIIGNTNIGSNAPSGYGYLQGKTDGKIYWKYESGTEYDLTAASGFGGLAVVSDADYTVAAGITHVIYSVMTAGRTVTLPSAASFTNRVLVIKNGGNGAFNITLSASVKENTTTTSTTIPQNYSYTLVSDGTDWWILNISNG